MGSQKTAPAAAAPRVASSEFPSTVRQVLAAWDFTHRQLEALWHIAQFLMYGGAKGGGKTVFLCRWAVLQCAMFIGNKVFLGRRRAVDFNNTTLETFKRYVDPRLYRINEQKKKIFLDWCKGQIDYGGLDDPEVVDRFNSAEYGAIGIDQAEEIDQDQLGSVVGTLRHVLPDGTFPSYQVRLTANPAECFLKYEYIENPIAGDPKTGQGARAFIKALHTDNPFLPPSYIPNLREALKHRPQLLKAYIEGIWDGLSALALLIQPSWIERAKTLVVDGPVRRRVVVNDPAREGDDENVRYVMELVGEAGQEKVRISPAAGAVHIEGHTKNLITSAQNLIKTRREHKASLICVDAVGIGAGIADHIDLQKDDAGNPEPLFRYVGGSTELPDPYKKKFRNVKSMAWHQCADWFRQNRCALPPDMPELGGQLLWQQSVLENELTERVLTKKELKAKRKRSPDQAETYVMGFRALMLAEDLPDERPVSKAEEFWKQVKNDVQRIENPEEDGGDWERV